MEVPMVDLRAQYRSIKNEIDQAITNVINDAAFVGGKYVGQFEKEFAAFCAAKHCVGVGNGTDALCIALRSLGVGKGDEIVAAPNSFIDCIQSNVQCITGERSREESNGDTVIMNHRPRIYVGN